MTTTEVAEQLGVSSATVARWCRDGRIPEAQKVKGRWGIPFEAVEHLRVELPQEWFVRKIRPMVEGGYDLMKDFGTRAARQIHSLLHDVVLERMATLLVRDYQIETRVKSVDSILRTWERLATEIESLRDDDFQDDKSAHKLFRTPFVVSKALEAMVGLVHYQLLVPMDGSPRSKLTAVLEWIEGDPFAPFLAISDIVGARVIMHNMRDLRHVAQLAKARLGTEIKSRFERYPESYSDEACDIREQDYISVPRETGYRSLHLNFHWPVPFESWYIPLPTEIQLRTSAQHLWGTLSHELFYHTESELVESSQNLTAQLAQLLEACDEIAEQIALDHAGQGGSQIIGVVKSAWSEKQRQWLLKPYPPWLDGVSSREGSRRRSG